MPVESPVDTMLERIGATLQRLRSSMLDVERRFASTYVNLPPNGQLSARNLLHYIALRHADLRPLQTELSALGVSSLEKAESAVLRSVETLIGLVRRLGAVHVGADTLSAESQAPTMAEGRRLLADRTRALLGPAAPGRDVRIMVTLPTRAADDYDVVRSLLEAGVNGVRINTAHDTMAVWDRMLRHVERARQETGRSCCVLMDLAGPQPRTGPMAPGPRVLRWRPCRDAYGHVLEPAPIWLTSRQRPQEAPQSAAACLFVEDVWLENVDAGDTITFRDARGSKRTLKVVARTDAAAWAEAEQTAYVVPSTALRLRRKGAADVRRHRRTVVGDLPPLLESILLAPGDLLIVSRTGACGSPAIVGPGAEVIQPAIVSTTRPELFDDVRPGEAIWFDDGKIGGVVRAVKQERVEVEITHANPGGAALRSDKSINLPESRLRLPPPLTREDLEHLPFIAARADLVGYSFVQCESDVEALQSRLAGFSGSPGLVLKIETRSAFDRLPRLLLAALRNPAAAVMVARGDLAVECGYERLAEVQEQILWMAEAAHTPVIWATQVMERLARTGIPSRGEVTDVAMAERAECVLLNKGPHIVEAVRAVDGILSRMEAHQKKKSTMLCQLDLATRFLQP